MHPRRIPRRNKEAQTSTSTSACSRITTLLDSHALGVSFALAAVVATTGCGDGLGLPGLTLDLDDVGTVSPPSGGSGTMVGSSVGGTGTGPTGSNPVGSGASSGSGLSGGGGTTGSGTPTGVSGGTPGDGATSGLGGTGSLGGGTTGSSTTGGSTGTTSGTSGGTTSGDGTTGVETTGGSSTTTPEPPVDVIPEDAQPTPESSGTTGAFRVSGGRLTHDGTPLQVRGGSWFGLEGQDDLQRPGAMELYIGSVYWADPSVMRTIEQTMQEVRSSMNINTIRLPLAPQCLVPGHPDGLSSLYNNSPEYYPYSDCREALEDFLVQADQHDLYVVLDIHSCSNHVGWRAGSLDDAPPYADSDRENWDYKKDDCYCDRGEDAYGVDRWLEDVHTLARMPKDLGIDNVIGIDCFNEPHKYSWSQWADLAAQCYQAIAAENDDLIAVVQGVAGSYVEGDTLIDQSHGDVSLNPNWGENLYGQQLDPIQIPKDRLCFSPHTYGPSVFVQKQFVDQSDPACVGLEDDEAGKAGCQIVLDSTLLRREWDEHFGYLKDQGYCIIIGEFGGYKDWPNNPVEPQAADIWSHLPAGARYDWDWQNLFVQYLAERGITDFFYWSINPESGDTGGLYNHAYSLSNESGWGVWQGIDQEKVNLLGAIP